MIAARGEREIHCSSSWNHHSFPLIFSPQRVYKLHDDVDLPSVSFYPLISLSPSTSVLSLSLSADKVCSLFSHLDLILNGGKLYGRTIFSSNRLIKIEISALSKIGFLCYVKLCVTSYRNLIPCFAGFCWLSSGRTGALRWFCTTVFYVNLRCIVYSDFMCDHDKFV